MDLFEALNKRYTYRGEFTDEPVTDEHVNLILQAGISAPTGMHITTNTYIAITDREIIKELAKWVPGSGVATASFVIVMVTENFARSYGVNFEIENYSASAENLLLAITALGYATIWTDGVLRSPQVNDGVRKVLNIPSEKTIRTVLPVGVPKKPEKPQVKERIEDVVIFQRYE